MASTSGMRSRTPNSSVVESSNSMNPPFSRNVIAVLEVLFGAFVTVISVHIAETDRSSEHDGPSEHVLGGFLLMPRREELARG